MRNPPIERAVRPSLIDRLIDTDPDHGDPPIAFSESVRRFKAGVLRDLQWLLNTRRIPEPVPATLEELRNSVYVYGLRDTTSRSADDPGVRRSLQREIAECIRLFEPRLTDVEVTLHTPTDKHERLVQFSIEATLLLDPEPERILVDTTLDPARGVISIAGASDA